MRTKDVGALFVRIFLVTWSGILRSPEQDFPNALFVEQPLSRSFPARDLDQDALCSAAHFERHSGHRGGMEMPVRIVIGKRRKQRGYFSDLRRESFPPIVIAVVDHGADPKNLLHAGSVFAGDANHHVRQFSGAEILFYDGTDSDVTGVIFRVTNGNGFGKRHADRITMVPGRRKEESGGKAPRLLHRTRATFPAACVEPDLEWRAARRAQPSFERRPRTRSLSALPSTVLPSRAALAAFTMAPICLMEVAPVSETALVMAASISASLALAGR